MLQIAGGAKQRGHQGGTGEAMCAGRPGLAVHDQLDHAARLGRLGDGRADTTDRSSRREISGHVIG